MKLRRGFKTEAEEYAREFRDELGLEYHAPLCPWTLADHLAIPVLPLSEFASEISKAVRYFMGTGNSYFSAVTIFNGHKRLIIHNDAHHPRRQSSNIAHELSHGILGHPPTPPLNEYGCRNFNKNIEDEATWLGSTLLIPRDVALYIVECGMPIDLAKVEYGVSSELITWRINITGVTTQIARRKQSRQRHSAI